MYAHTKNTCNPGECVFAQQHSLFHFRPISRHLIPAQELAMRNVHTLLCIQHLIWAEEIGKKRRKEESAERWGGQQMRGKKDWMEERRTAAREWMFAGAQISPVNIGTKAKAWIWDGGRREDRERRQRVLVGKDRFPLLFFLKDG